eukprot:scaffold768_cov382-Prasinococcus_capsulatus_cf.AAC.2
MPVAVVAGGPAEDPAHFASRSPHATIHLLRQCDVDAALREWERARPLGATADIQANNAARLRGLGLAFVEQLFSARCAPPGYRPPRF